MSESFAPQRATVRESRRECADTVSLLLESPLATPSPGQFNMLYLPGRGESAISVSGIDRDARQVMHTVKAVGAVTEALTRLPRGAPVGVRGPFGSAWPLDALVDRDVLIVGGGIGFAPLRPVVAHIASRRAAYGRVAVLFGCRRPDDVLFAPDFDRWRAHFDVHVTVDRTAPGWRGEVGFVTERLTTLALDPVRTSALVCGPEVMMRHAVRELGRRGVDDADMHVAIERNMRCAIGLCGHCQWGPHFVCRDGPVYRFDRIRDLFAVREM